jgi:hypothetical protein
MMQKPCRPAFLLAICPWRAGIKNGAGRIPLGLGHPDCHIGIAQGVTFC